MNIQIEAQKFYQYSTYIRGYSHYTITRYKFAINFYCKIANVCNFEEVTVENVKALFFHGRTERKWKVSTFLTIHKSLVVFFRWAHQQGLLNINPAEGLELPRLEKRLPTKLTKQAALRLLEVAYHYPYTDTFLRYRNHAVFSMFLFAGLRKNELFNLKLADVDIENLTIFVRQGKGSKDRIIPMSFTLANSLKRYLDERKRKHKTCPEFFASLNRNMGITEMCLKLIVIQLRKASGMHFTIHWLRHTFATLMLEGGCDIYSLSKMMGHSDIKTTTIYLSASAEHLRNQITKHPLN
ncbi:MAG: hypothetical protein JWN78_1632 [Bacteroidota bacterium]|nr:hypothetical protein [Bacteroidota bacterium]